MFPKNKINLIVRLLCLISYIVVIIIVNSTYTLMVLGVAYILFALAEKNFRDIELIVLSIVIFAICHLINNYLLFKIMLVIDYIIYYLDSRYYIDEEVNEELSERDYIRFKNVKKKKEKGSNNLIALYLTVHLVILFLAIMVG